MREIHIVIGEELVAIVKENGSVLWRFFEPQVTSTYGSLVEDTIKNFDTYYGKVTLLPNTNVKIDGEPKVNLKKAAREHLGNEAFSLKQALHEFCENFDSTPILPAEDT